MKFHRSACLSALLIAACLVISACGGESIDTPDDSSSTTKSAALLLTGSASEGGWNTSAYDGLKALKKKGYKTAYAENLDEAKIRDSIEGYAQSGYKLIIGNGFEFGSIMAELAPQYPDSMFFAMTAKPQAEQDLPSNVLYISLHYNDVAYIDGALAAMISQKHVVGVVGGGDNPTQKGMLASFKKGATTTVDGTRALSVLTGDYNDPARGKAAATTMIGQGADVISHFADTTGLGALTGAAKKDALLIGYYSDQSNIAPKNIATSIDVRLNNVVTTLAAGVADETIKGGTEWDPGVRAIWRFVYNGKQFNTKIVTKKQQDHIDKLWDRADQGKLPVS